MLRKLRGPAGNEPELTIGCRYFAGIDYHERSEIPAKFDTTIHVVTGNPFIHEPEFGVAAISSGAVASEVHYKDRIARSVGSPKVGEALICGFHGRSAKVGHKPLPLSNRCRQRRSIAIIWDEACH